MEVVVVAEIELIAALVENSERGVQPRCRSGGHEIEDDLLAGLAVESEHVVVVLGHHPIDQDGQRNRLGVREFIIWFKLALLRKRADVKDTDVAAGSGSEAKILQTGRDVRGNRDFGLDREKIGREKLRLNISPRKAQVDRILEVAAGDEHLYGRPPPRA